MLLDPAGQRDLLADLRARRARELDLREVGLDGEHAAAGRRRADVDEQELALCELGDLRLLLVLRLDAEQPAEEEEADLELCAGRR
jgi:hypothetical protein